MLRSNLQDIMDQHMEMCNMISTLHLLNTEQQQRIDLERERSKKMEDKLKKMVSSLTEHEDYYKVSLEKLVKENKDLRRSLVDIQHERDRAELASNAKVSKLQDEIELLRMQITQLSNEYKQQLALKNKQHEDEIFKYERPLKDLSASLFKEKKQNIAKKSKIQSERIREKHPALTNTEGRQNTKKFPGLEIRKTINKKRKLFQENDDTVDII